MAVILNDRRNPFLGRIFAEMRSTSLQTDRLRFRTNLHLLGLLLGYEIAATLETKVEQVTTPLGVADVDVVAERPVLCAVLRAALPFWEGMLEVFRDSDSMILGAARREGRREGASLDMEIDLSYAAIPDCHGRDWIFCDPMLATGSTILALQKLLDQRGFRPRRLIIASAIGYRGAIERLEAELPGVEIWLAACDDILNENGYIVPGLGDAGDLCFGSKRGTWNLSS